MDLLLNIASVIKYRKIGIVVTGRYKSGLEISYYQVNRRNNSVDTCLVQEGIASFKDIPLSAEKVPNILCIQGNGLVQRIIDPGPDDITQSIPNIEPEEYLIQSDELPDSKKLTALFRKEQLRSVIDDPEFERIPVCGISLGFTGLQNFMPLFNGRTNEFDCGGNLLLINDGMIAGVKKSRQTVSRQYRFAGADRTPGEILALSAALNFYTGRQEKGASLPELKQKIREITAKKLSEYMIKYAGAALFILLLINFLCFDHFSKKLNRLNMESQEVIKLQSEIKGLREELIQKKQFISQNNVPENYSFAFYADRLASFTAGGIRFSELSICPAAGKIKEDKVITFKGNTMQVKGTSPDPAVFSSFMEKINNAGWVAKVNRQIYRYNTDHNNAEFELEIVLDNATE